MENLKEQLYKLCIDYVKKRMAEAKQAIEDSQEAAIEETKSSAGDKYETSREMMQQATDRNMAQLNEAGKLMVALNKINYNFVTDLADAGSLVLTNNGKFYIAISAGALSIGGETFFAVSPASPIGLQLCSKKAGHEFVLNGKSYKIESIV